MFDGVCVVVVGVLVIQRVGHVSLSHHPISNIKHFINSLSVVLPTLYMSLCCV